MCKSLLLVKLLAKAIQHNTKFPILDRKFEKGEIYHFMEGSGPCLLLCLSELAEMVPRLGSFTYHSPYENHQVSIILSFHQFQINFRDTFTLLNIYKF